MNKVQMTIELFESKREVEKLNAVGECLMQEVLILQKVGNIIDVISDKKQADLLMVRLKEIGKEMAQVRIEMQLQTKNLNINLDDFGVEEIKPEDLN